MEVGIGRTHARRGLVVRVAVLLWSGRAWCSVRSGNEEFLGHQVVLVQHADKHCWHSDFWLLPRPIYGCEIPPCA
jgi:hypothetical protein